MFADEPHQVTKYYTGLLPLIPSRIFNPDHNLYPYYVAAYAGFRLESLFRNRYLDPAFKAYRYPLLTGFKYYVLSGDSVDPAKKDAEAGCKPLTTVLCDQSASAERFRKVIELVMQLEKEEDAGTGRQSAKSAALRNRLIERLGGRVRIRPRLDLTKNPQRL
jgi:hypothetical protein